LTVYEFETESEFSLWFEAGGLLFLLHLAVGILLRPYSDMFLQRDLLNKAFKVDAREKEKLLANQTANLPG